MKKKISYVLILLLAVVFLFAFVACGQSGKNNEDQDNQGGTQVTPKPPIDDSTETHKHELSQVSAKSADCVNAGNIAYYTCSCGKWFSDNNANSEITDKSSVVIKATGHNYAFDWTSSKTQHWHECTVCGNKKDIANHTAGAAATETTAQICTTCEYVIAVPLGHPHLTSLVSAISADCTTQGNIAYYICSCGKWFSDDKATSEIIDKSSVVIKATGHKYSSEWSSSDKQHWHACSACGDKKDIENHNLINDKCSVCKYESDSLIFTQYGNGYAVTGYTGSATSVTVPATYQGKSVTAIGTGYDGFRSCFDLEEIKLPDSIRVINFYAFENCGSLKKIELPNQLISIGNNAFRGCIRLEEIEIPNGISTIEFDTFYGCIGLKNVIIPNSVTTISSSAFEGCSHIDSITIPMCALGAISKDSLKAVCLTNGSELADSAFESGANLREITLPDSLLSIGRNAFSGCSGLTSIVIPHGVTSIGYYAFQNCTSLTEIALPRSVTDISESIFRGCEKLENVTVPFVGYKTNIGSYRYLYPFGYLFGTTQYSGSVAVQQRSITTTPNNSTSTNNVTYYFPAQLKQVTVLKGDIESYAFYNCKFSKVIIGNAVSTIGDYAFSACSGLTSMDIPISVTSIKSFAFAYCSGLTNIAIPDSVTWIGPSAFYHCRELTSVTIGNKVTELGDSAFSNCDKLTQVTIGNSVEQIGESAFANCSELSSIVIPQSVIRIWHSAFSCCSKLTSITIPNGVTYIGNSAFSGCSGLIDVTIPNSVTTMGTAVFEGCSSLKNMTIPFIGPGDRFPEPKNYEKVFGYLFGYYNTTYIDTQPPTERIDGGILQYQEVEIENGKRFYTGYYYYIPKSLEHVYVSGNNFTGFKNCDWITVEYI